MGEGAIMSRPTQQQAWTRIAVSGLAIGGTIWATSAFLNRDTREGGLNAFEREYLHGTFRYTGAGLLATAIGARVLFKTGFAVRIMMANPWLVLGAGLVGGVGSMMGVFYTSPENTTLRHAFWLAFNASQAATLSPLFFFNPAILARAALYTCGVVGSLSYVGATAKSDKFLYMGGPLLAGVTVVALSGLAPMALPLGMRGLAVAESISLYGGLAVFGGFVLYDTQKILHHARMAQAGMVPHDTMRESISLQLDFINIFVRLVQILAMQQGRKK
ncbi:inhibitor of apoptosis-promoting Bax1-domain-containing protein [Auriculariales sp. MPI-PUGE-AT-0066]|nr:inhibitor of apoptosis-promoting Bax1-domain-containing protein [Auriculariales sp. MPI-PUGE-AT-0066]